MHRGGERASCGASSVSGERRGRAGRAGCSEPRLLTGSREAAPPDTARPGGQADQSSRSSASFPKRRGATRQARGGLIRSGNALSVNGSEWRLGRELQPSGVLQSWLHSPPQLHRPGQHELLVNTVNEKARPIISLYSVLG